MNYPQQDVIHHTSHQIGLCAYCGNEVHQALRYCLSCGKSAYPVQSPTLPAKKPKWVGQSVRERRQRPSFFYAKEIYQARPGCRPIMPVIIALSVISLAGYAGARLVCAQKSTMRSATIKSVHPVSQASSGAVVPEKPNASVPSSAPWGYFPRRTDGNSH